MELPRQLTNLISFANTVNAKKDDKKISLFATAITSSNEQIPLIMPSGMSRLGAYALNYSDDLRLAVQLQPGVYQNKILPSKDNLIIEVVERIGLTQTMRRYRAIPMGDSNPQMAGNNTAVVNMGAKDQLNLITVNFQMMELGYAILKNEMISDNHLGSDLYSVLHSQLSKFGAKINLHNDDAWKGVDIEKPIDNARVFSIISITPAIRLPELGTYLQSDERFGVYSRGLGMYYRKGMWYVYPLFKIGRYENARKVLNIYRLPENVFPTLHATHFTQGKVTTILATGQGKHVDGKDIIKQNVGTGKRVVNADAAMGEVGYYYAKGQAAVSRTDTLSEYKTSSRASGEELIPFTEGTSNNLCKNLSANAFNEGTLETIQWNNSNPSELVPGMPVRFFYMVDDILMYREGTLLADRTELTKDTQSPDFVFRRHTALSLFLVKEEKNAP